MLLLPFWDYRYKLDRITVKVFSCVPLRVEPSRLARVVFFLAQSARADSTDSPFCLVLGRATRYAMRQVENFRFVVVNGLSALSEDQVHHWRHIDRRQLLPFHSDASDTMMNKAPGTLECFRSFLLKIRGNYPVLKLKIHRVFWVKFSAKPRKEFVPDCDTLGLNHVQ